MPAKLSTKTTTGIVADGVTTTILAIPFKPILARFVVTKEGNSDSSAQMSVGATDGTSSYAVSTLVDQIAISRRTNDFCIAHYAINPSTQLSRKVVSAKFVSWSATGIELLFDRADAGFQIEIELIG